MNKFIFSLKTLLITLTLLMAAVSQAQSPSFPDAPSSTDHGCPECFIFTLTPAPTTINITLTNKPLVTANDAGGPTKYSWGGTPATNAAIINMLGSNVSIDGGYAGSGVGPVTSTDPGPARLDRADVHNFVKTATGSSFSVIGRTPVTAAVLSLLIDTVSILSWGNAICSTPQCRMTRALTFQMAPVMVMEVPDWGVAAMSPQLLREGGFLPENFWAKGSAPRSYVNPLPVEPGGFVRLYRGGKVLGEGTNLTSSYAFAQNYGKVSTYLIPYEELQGFYRGGVFINGMKADQIMMTPAQAKYLSQYLLK